MGVGEPSRLVGRTEEIAELREGARSGTSPLTVLAGEPGSGLSSVLRELADQLEADGTVLRVRLSEADRDLPYAALFRLLNQLSPDEPGDAARQSVLGLVTRLGEDAVRPIPPEVSAKVASAVFSVLRAYAPLVLVVDDAQWLDQATARLLAPAARLCAGGAQVAVVASVRLAGARIPVPGGAFVADVVNLLRAEGRARLLLLRPLAAHASRTIIADLVAAAPDADLVDAVHTACRGNPAALLATIGGCRAADTIRVVDRTAYLVYSVDRRLVIREHPLLDSIREAGGPTWAVAGAMAVLSRLGPIAPRLVAAELGLSEDAVRLVLAELTERRVLVHDPDPANGGSWRFRALAVRVGLVSSLGPYVWRSLAAAAATAIWDGVTPAPDEDFLFDRLAEAGSLVDRERSAEELLAKGAEVLFTDGYKAERWLRAAAERVVTPAKRATTLLALSSARAVHNRMAQATEFARPVLLEHSKYLTPELTQEIAIVYVTGLSACRAVAELRDVAEGIPARLPGDAAQDVVTRAFALMLLGRWRDGNALLRDNESVWRQGNGVTVDFAETFLGGSGVLLGDPSRLFGLIRDPGLWRAEHMPQHRFEHRRFEVDMLLLLGEYAPARRHLAGAGLTTAQLPGPDRFLMAWLGGRWDEAMEIARRTLLEDLDSARPLPAVVMVSGAIRILGAQGWLSRAREMAAITREVHLRHMADYAESTVLRKLGDHDTADALLHRAQRLADEGGYVLGTEELWAGLVRASQRAGDRARVEYYLGRSAETARKLDTTRAHLAHLMVRAEAMDDRESGERAVELVRGRAGLPYEDALVLMRAGLCGIDTRKLLGEAYELFGEVGALYWRARMRKHLRDRKLPAPGRAETTTENQRLLAVLVAEGLSNRQLAQVFGASEKSVEGRLTRMFARIGYRSRVELAAAILTGEYVS